MSAFSDFEIDAVDLGLQTLFRVVLCHRTDAHADANAAVMLVDETASVGVDRDPWGAS